MFSFSLFILSGVALAALVVAKRYEMKGPGDKKVILLRAISKGDERARDLYHTSLRLYTDGKVRVVFLVRKQLPVKVKIYFNKSLSWAQEELQSRFGDIRNSRLINKPNSISDFFKTISEIEKGRGELHEEMYVEEEPEILAYRITPVPAPTVETETTTLTEEVEAKPAKAPKKPAKPRAPRKPRVKKIKVVEVNEY